MKTVLKRSVLCFCWVSLAYWAVGSLRPLTFGERVAAQRALDQVLYDHRLWPEQNPGAKPAFEAALPAARSEERVADGLRRNTVLRELWGFELTAEELQAELDRMARQTKDPTVLAELFAALGNDPRLAAECLARPVLEEAALRRLYAADGALHAEARRCAEAGLARLAAGDDPESVGGAVAHTLYRRVEGGAPAPEDGAVLVAAQDWTALRGSLLGERAASGGSGGWSPLREEEGAFVTTALTAEAQGRLEVCSVAWEKRPLEEWWSEVGSQFAPESREPQAASYTLPTPAPAAATETWSDITTNNAPASLTPHSAVWTGSEMIVWGGWNKVMTDYQTGGRYTPATDSWSATGVGAGTPSARKGHTAVWTGSKMVVWGGGREGGTKYDSGGLYDPATDGWSPTSTGSGCPTARDQHTAVWSGSEMVVWGGSPTTSPTNTGARYSPVAGSWTAMSTSGAPAARALHEAAWDATLSGMKVWGGVGNGSTCLATGGLYQPSGAGWSTLSPTNAPSARYGASSVVYSGSFLVWGGTDCSSNLLDTGGVHAGGAPGSWSATSGASAKPSARMDHTAVWTGSDMWVWGGRTGSGSGDQTDTGARLNPSTGSWYTMTTTGAPDRREEHTALWTGRSMLVWGGHGGLLPGDPALLTGGVYAYCPGAPTVLGIPTAADAEGCVLSGVTVSWNTPSDWGDGGVGSSERGFVVLRDGAALASGGCSGLLPAGTTSCTDGTGTAGLVYSYAVRFINGCGQTTTSSAGSEADYPTTPAGAIANGAADLDACEDSGVRVSWSTDPFDWGDGGHGGRSYRVSRDGVALTSGGCGGTLGYGTLYCVDATGVNGTSYTYSVTYQNGCGLQSTTVGASAADRVVAAPSGTGNNSAFDGNACSDYGVAVMWSLPADWGDGGSGTRSIHVLRDGVDLTPVGLSPTATGMSDETGVNGTTYTYSVRFINGCGAATATVGAQAADLVDTTPCSRVDDTLRVYKNETDAILRWETIDCADIRNYVVYTADSVDAAFPSAWYRYFDPEEVYTSIGYSLSGSAVAFMIVSKDQCLNESGP